MVSTKEKQKEAKRRWNENNKDKNSFYRWKSRRENPEKYKKMNNDYYAKHKDKINAKRRDAYRTDEEKRNKQIKMSRAYFKKTYVPSTRKIMTPEEKKEAKKKALIKYREKNRELLNEKRRERYGKNRPIEIACSMKNKNQPRQNELRKKRYKTDKDYKKRQLGMCSDYYTNNKEHFKSYQQDYMKSENGKATRKVCSQRRRARKANVISTLTKKDWLAIRDKSPICFGCHRFVECETLSHDHLIPLKKKGENTIENSQALCFSCNSSKNCRRMEDWDNRNLDCLWKVRIYN